MPEPTHGNNRPDAAKAAADAAYISRAAVVMRWVVRLAIVATVVVLFFIVEPLVREIFSGDAADEMMRAAEQRAELMKEGRDPGEFALDRFFKQAATIMGGFVMLFLLVVLNGILRRMEKPAPPRRD